jgi:uncharacterized protein YjbJ (UPF0337 family)
MPLQIKDSNWKNFKSKVRSNFSKMRDHEIETTRGRMELLVKKIKSRYGSSTIDPEAVLEKCVKESKCPK